MKRKCKTDAEVWIFKFSASPLKPRHFTFTFDGLPFRILQVPRSVPFHSTSCNVGLAKGDGETPPSVRPFSPTRWTRGKKVPYLFTDSAGVKNVRKRELRRVSSYDRKGKSWMQFDSPPTNVPLDIRKVFLPLFPARILPRPFAERKLIFGGVERCVGFFSFKLAFYSWR